MQLHRREEGQCVLKQLAYFNLRAPSNSQRTAEFLRPKASASNILWNTPFLNRSVFFASHVSLHNQLRRSDFLLADCVACFEVGAQTLSASKEVEGSQTQQEHPCEVVWSRRQSTG